MTGSRAEKSSKCHTLEPSVNQTVDLRSIKHFKSNTQIFCYTEIWYLVKYEDDENLRVLAEDEIRHIFPDEEEGNEMQIGDVVSALWIPNGQYYDAKILMKGGE